MKVNISEISTYQELANHGPRTKSILPPVLSCAYPFITAETTGNTKPKHLLSGPSQAKSDNCWNKMSSGNGPRKDACTVSPHCRGKAGSCRTPSVSTECMLHLRAALPLLVFKQ